MPDRCPNCGSIEDWSPIINGRWVGDCCLACGWEEHIKCSQTDNYGGGLILFFLVMLLALPVAGWLFG